MVGRPLSPGTCDKIQWSRILAFRWFGLVRGACAWVSAVDWPSRTLSCSQHTRLKTSAPMAWACTYPLSLCNRQCECRVRVAASAQQQHTSLLRFCAILGCARKRSCPNTTVMRGIDLDDHPQLHHVTLSSPPDARSALKQKYSLLRGPPVPCIRHLRDLTREEKPINHARVFRDPHSVLSLIFKRPLEMNAPFDDAEPTTGQTPPDPDRLLRSDCRREEHRHQRLAGQRAGWFPLSAVSYHARHELHRSRPVLHNGPRRVTGRRGCVQNLSQLSVRLSCARIDHPARAKKWTFFPASGRRRSVQPSLVCFCVFSSIASQIKQAQVLARPHQCLVCASDGLHVGNDGRNIQGKLHPGASAAEKTDQNATGSNKVGQPGPNPPTPPLASESNSTVPCSEQGEGFGEEDGLGLLTVGARPEPGQLTRKRRSRRQWRQPLNFYTVALL